MERLIVKNFGPLKYVDIELRDVNVFIGPTGSGKSTLAKLVAVMNSWEFKLSSDVELFSDLLKNFGVYTFLEKETTIEYHSSFDYLWKFSNGKIESNYPYGQLNLNMLRTLGHRSKRIFHRGSLFKRAIEHLATVNYARIKDKRVRSLLEGIQKKLIEIDSYTSNKKILDENDVKVEFLQESLLESSHLLYDKIFKNSSTYIPAERILFSTILSSLVTDTIPLMEYIKRFTKDLEYASLYNEETGEEGKFDIPELGLTFVRNEEVEEQWNLKISKGILPLNQSASGIQSILPMALMVSEFTQDIDHYLIIEEPELNLFPAQQMRAISYLLSKFNNGNNNKAIFTTHSPYILSSIDNLITANSVATEKPKLKKKVAEVIDEKYWLSYDRVSAYYFNPTPKRGKTNTESIMNAERKGIAGNAIDSVSDELNIQYEKLNELRYS